MAEIKPVHLVVFVHGLWGNPSHLQYLVDLFAHTHGDKLHLLNAKCNASNYTYDGVDVCGKRLVGEIKEELKLIKEMNVEVTKFSIIGYSLGGLISRHAIGLLYSQGFFKNIKPMFFTTFATPHLGIRKDDTVWSKIVNWTSSNLLSETGEQLQYIDKFEGNEPLLYVMSKPDTVYYKALESFKYRKIYANALRDLSVPFWTAAITDVSPFDSRYNELDIVTNEKWVDIIESISLLAKPEENSLIQTPTMKLIPYYALAAVALPILIPIGGVILLSTLPTQLSKSKQRIQQEKTKEEKEEREEREIDTIAANAEEIVFETAMNLKNLTNNSTPNISTQQEENSEQSALKFDTRIRLSNFATSPLFPKVPISEAQHNSFLNLNKLQLDKVVVCMNHAIHPHASIIVRSNFYDEGKQLLKTYVEEVFQP